MNGRDENKGQQKEKKGELHGCIETVGSKVENTTANEAVFLRA